MMDGRSPFCVRASLNKLGFCGNYCFSCTFKMFAGHKGMALSVSEPSEHFQFSFRVHEALEDFTFSDDH